MDLFCFLHFLVSFKWSEIFMRNRLVAVVNAALVYEDYEFLNERHTRIFTNSFVNYGAAAIIIIIIVRCLQCQ